MTKSDERPAHLAAGSSNTNLAMSYDDAFELTGFGLFNYIAMVASSLIFMHALIEQVATAYVLDPAMCELNLTVREKGLVASAIFFGIGSTAVCWGTLSDHIGRRSVMLPAIFLACIFSFASSMTFSFWPLFILRILTGVMVSASSATILVYLGELVTHKHRDLAISVAVTSVAVVFCLIPRLVGAGLLIILPESPSFLMSSKGSFKALPVLERIYKMNNPKEGRDFPVTALMTSASSLHSGDHSGIKGTLNDMLQLVKPPMLSCFLLTHFAMFMVFLLANGIYLWTPSIFNMVLEDTSLRWTVCDVLCSPTADAHSMIDWFLHHDDEEMPLSPDEKLHAGGIDCKTGKINQMMYAMAVVMEIVLLIPFLIVDCTIEKLDDKRILYALVLGPCAVCLALSVLVPNIVVSSGILLTLGICSGSGAAVLSALAVDAFPTSLRALAMCTMYMFGHLGSVVGNTLTAASVGGPCVVIFLVMAGSIAATVAALMLFWPNLEIVRRKMEDRGFSY